jgi:hypothetical protein
MIIITHLPCSPDLVWCFLFPFPKLSVVLKGRRFNDITMTKVKSRPHLTSCRQCTLQNALNGGTVADPTDESPKKTTSEGTALVRRQVLWLWKNKFRPETI